MGRTGRKAEGLGKQAWRARKCAWTTRCRWRLLTHARTRRFLRATIAGCWQRAATVLSSRLNAGGSKLCETNTVVCALTELQAERGGSAPLQRQSTGCRGLGGLSLCHRPDSGVRNKEIQVWPNHSLRFSPSQMAEDFV